MLLSQMGLAWNIVLGRDAALVVLRLAPLLESRESGPQALKREKYGVFGGTSKLLVLFPSSRLNCCFHGQCRTIECDDKYF
jgi:hypothetical protein